MTYDDAGGAAWGPATVSGTELRLVHAPFASGPTQGRTIAMILTGTGAHE